MNRHSVRFRLVGMLVVSVVFLLGLFTAQAYFLAKKQLYSNYEETIQSVRERLEINLALPLWRLDMDTINQNLEAEIKEPVVGIEIYERIGDPALATYYAKNRELGDKLDEETNKFPLRIHKDGVSTELGVVLLITSKGKIDLSLHELIWSRMIEVAVVVLLLLAAFSLLLQKLIFHPLNALKNALVVAANLKNLNERLILPGNGKDEFSDVGASFELITKRLTDDQVVLRKAYQHQIELTDQLEIAKREAEAAAKTKGDFLANMSHEIRTPMNAIIGLTRIVQKTELSAQQHDYLQKIYSSSQHLLGILNDILDFSKIESQKLEIEHEGFSLTSVLENISSLIGTKASEKGLEFLFDIDPDVPDLLVGDALRLGQILINYGNNAIKFTESGEVCIRVKQQQRERDKIFLRFEVVDTGVGLTQEQIQRLFQSFSQADASTTRKYGGTGLGLAISKTLAELMQGQVGVESTQGKGSTFWFTAWMGVSEQQILPIETIKDLRVLVVDDNASAREILTHMLQGWQCEASSVDGGLASIQAVQAVDQSAQPYDLVLMDWQMPDLDGIEAIRRIQALQLTHPPKVVMITAFGRSDVLQACNDVKVQEVLSKPINPSMLYNTLMRSMGTQQVMQQAKDLSQARDVKYSLALQRIAGARILLVEDNDLNQLVATELLRSEGFVVEVADNGQIAVDKVRAEDAHWDLVLMDMQMPVMDGISATLEIRKTISANALPIVAMTANAMNEDRDRCLASGMQGFVRKPIEPAELWEALCAWIAPRQAPAQRHEGAPSQIAASTAIQQAASTVVDRQAWFDGVSGLDVELGLSRVRDNADLFETMLRRFAAGQARVAEDIRDALQTGDVATARRLAHTLKAVAANIGAAGLQQVAADLEDWIVQEQTDRALAGLGELSGQLQPLLSGLQAAFAAKAAATTTAQAVPLDVQKFQQVSTQMLGYIENDDSEAVQCLQSNAGLLRAGLGDNYEKVRALLEAFEFQAAQALIESALESHSEVS